MNKIAILLAAYNGEKYIAEQIESLLSQTEKNFVCYVHDDGSTDSTINILKKYELMFPEKIVILNYSSTGGAKNNFLSMLANVEEDYVMFCDQDDVWLPNKIEKTFKTMVLSEEKFESAPVCVFTDMYVVDENLRVISDSFLKRMKKNPTKISVLQLLCNNVVAGCTLMINKQCIELSRFYQDANNIRMHDWWCALVAATCGYLVFLDAKTSLYRQHSVNVIGASHNQFVWLKKIKFNLLNHQQIERSREGIVAIKSIGKELVLLPNINEQYINFLSQLLLIDKYGKYKRMYFFAKNKLLKKDIKNIWKILLV